MYAGERRRAEMMWLYGLMVGNQRRVQIQKMRNEGHRAGRYTIKVNKFYRKSTDNQRAG